MVGFGERRDRETPETQSVIIGCHSHSDIIGIIESCGTNSGCFYTSKDTRQIDLDSIHLIGKPHDQTGHRIPDLALHRHMYRDGEMDMGRSYRGDADRNRVSSDAANRDESANRTESPQRKVERYQKEHMMMHQVDCHGNVLYVKRCVVYIVCQSSSFGGDGDLPP